jgi:hypothetical protein
VRVLDRQRDMVGLDALDAHVVFHDLAGDHDGFYFLKSKKREEALGAATSRTTMVM